MNRSVLECTESSIKIIPAGVMVWMTKHEIADLLGCFVAKIGTNITAILKAGILDEDAVCCRHRHDSGGSFVELYNLEMITALAFRIKSQNAEIFRCWLMEQAVHRPVKPVAVFVPWSEKIFLN